MTGREIKATQEIKSHASSSNRDDRNLHTQQYTSHSDHQKQVDPGKPSPLFELSRNLFSRLSDQQKQAGSGEPSRPSNYSDLFNQRNFSRLTGGWREHIENAFKRFENPQPQSVSGSSFSDNYTLLSDAWKDLVQPNLERLQTEAGKNDSPDFVKEILKQVNAERPWTKAVEQIYHDLAKEILKLCNAELPKTEAGEQIYPDFVKEILELCNAKRPRTEAGEQTHPGFAKESPKQDNAELLLERWGGKLEDTEGRLVEVIQTFRKIGVDKLVDELVSQNIRQRLVDKIKSGEVGFPNALRSFNGALRSIDDALGTVDGEHYFNKLLKTDLEVHLAALTEAKKTITPLTKPFSTIAFEMKVYDVLRKQVEKISGDTSDKFGFQHKYRSQIGEVMDAYQEVHQLAIQEIDTSIDKTDTELKEVTRKYEEHERVRKADREDRKSERLFARIPPIE